MQAEDIHVANLLQWGNARHFQNAPQYAFGPDGLYHEGDYWLAAGPPCQSEYRRIWNIYEEATASARPLAAIR